MRFLCLLASFFLLVAFGARAQDSLARARPAALVPAAASTDTLAALHRLFLAKRSVRTVVVGSTLAVSGLTIGVILVNDAPNGSYHLAPLEAAFVGLVTLPVVLAELAYFGKNYGRRREQRAIAAFQAHHLDAALKEKLTPQYFQPSPIR